MYNRLKHKYTNLKRSIREISGCASQLPSAWLPRLAQQLSKRPVRADSDDDSILRRCNASPEEPADGERVGKLQKTGTDRRTASPRADDDGEVTPATRGGAAASPEQEMTTPADTAAAVGAQPPAPRPSRARPDATDAPAADPPAELAATDAPSETAEEAATASEGGGSAEGAAATSATSASASPAASEDEVTELAVTLSGGQASSVNVDEGTTDDEAASLALAMQLMQQEQALAQIYGESGEAAGHAGFGAEQTAEEEQQHWIPAEEIEEVQAEDVLEESEATYEQLLELDEQKVVVGLSERAKAQATTVVKLTEADVAALKTLHDKRCCICLCDYEVGDEVRKLPCAHGCHVDCMDQHLGQAKTCPMCRTEILTPQARPEAQ